MSIAHVRWCHLELTDDRLIQLLTLNHHTELRTMLDVNPDWTVQPCLDGAPQGGTSESWF